MGTFCHSNFTAAVEKCIYWNGSAPVNLCHIVIILCNTYLTLYKQSLFLVNINKTSFSSLIIMYGIVIEIP